MPSIRGGTQSQPRLAQPELACSRDPPKAKVTWNAVVCDILVSVSVGICRLTLSLEGTAESSGQRTGD